ncbi:unnamed protein product [Calypogeia fissa]
MASTSTSNSSILGPNQRNDSIYTFYEPSDRPHEAEVFFFHDIQQSENDELHTQTWMSSSQPSVCWPTEWLSEEIPWAQISSARYHGAIWKTDTSGNMPFRLIVEDLRQDIVQLYTKACPIFFVGHGLGGLIIKGMVKEMEETRNTWHQRVSYGNANTGLQLQEKLDRLTSFLENIKGVFFYNIPSLGIRLADDTKNFPNRSLLMETLGVLHGPNSQLNEWFSGWRKSHGCKCMACFGPLPTKVLGTQAWWLRYELKEASVRYDTDDFYTAPTSDHYDVCKPSNKIDNRFQCLVRFLRESREASPEARGTPRGSMATINIEDGAEIESGDLLSKIMTAVSKLPKGEGVWLKVQDLEKIRKSTEANARLVRCFRKACLVQESVSASMELWRRLYDHEIYLPHL